MASHSFTWWKLSVGEQWSLRKGVSPICRIRSLLSLPPAKAELDEVERCPRTPEGRRGNVDRAIEFLKSDEVILHPDAVKGVASHMTSRC